MKTCIFIMFVGALMGCSSSRSPEITHLTEPLFPHYGPIADANPEIREKRKLRVPTKLVVIRSEESISVSFDTNSYTEIELEVGYKMVIGYRHEVFVVSDGERGSYLYGDGTGVGLGTYIMSRKLHGIPVPGQNYIVELRLTIFETDIPSQHMWNPRSEKYRELWTKTLRSSEI